MSPGEPFSSIPFDLDIHEIPARGAIPAHLHFDIRYHFVIPRVEPRRSEESHEVAWLDFAEALRRNPEDSIRRPLAKLEALRIRRGRA